MSCSVLKHENWKFVSASWKFAVIKLLWHRDVKLNIFTARYAKILLIA